MSGYAARLRLLRQVLQDGSAPAAEVVQVGVVGRGGAAALFEDGTRLSILSDQVQVSVSSSDAAPSAVMAFATRLSDIAGVPLILCAADMSQPDPAPSPS